MGIHPAYACLVATLHAASGFLVDCVIYYQVRLLEYTRQHLLDVFDALQQRQISKIKLSIIVYMFLRKKLMKVELIHIHAIADKKNVSYAYNENAY